MSLFNSLKKRLTNQFLAVIVYEDKCNIKQKIVKNSKLLHKEEFNFDIKSKDDLGGKVINFINTLQGEHDNTYIALFLNTLGQGIIPICDENALAKFNVDHKNVKSICKDNHFLMYATLIDVKWADKLFQRTGLDFVFSPFLVLDFFINKAIKRDSYNKEEVVLYILNTYNALTLMIQKGDKFLYGAFFNIAKGEDLLYTDYNDTTEDEEIEELNLDDISDLEIEDIMDVSNQSNFVTNILQSGENISEEDERIIKYLNSSLKEFYSNELYNSEFITAARIYDDVGINEGVMKYIENELLLDTSAENISVSDVILELSMQEASI